MWVHTRAGGVYVIVLGGVHVSVLGGVPLKDLMCLVTVSIDKPEQPEACAVQGCHLPEQGWVID